MPELTDDEFLELRYAISMSRSKLLNRLLTEHRAIREQRDGMKAVLLELKFSAILTSEMRTMIDNALAACQPETPK